jgi:hypothetical protein
MDSLMEDEIEEIIQNTLKELDLPKDTKYFVISAATGQNVKDLLAEAMGLIEEIQTQENERQAEEEAQAKSSSFVWTSPRERIAQRIHDDWEDDWDNDWDDEFWGVFLVCKIILNNVCFLHPCRSVDGESILV